MQATNGKTALFITPYVWTSGPNKGMPTVFQTLRGFAEQGYDVHVIIPTNQELEDRDAQGIHYHYVKVGRLIVTQRFDEEFAIFSAIRSRSRVLRHLKSRFIWLGFVVLASIRAVRFVRSMSNVHVVYAITHFATIPGFIASRWTEAVFVQRLYGSHALLGLEDRNGNLPWWTPLLRFDELLAFRIPADLLILGNDGTGVDKQAVRFGADPHRIRHLLNGVDADVFRATDIAPLDARVQLNVPIESGRIVSIGRLCTWKRVDRLIRAIPLVLQGFPDVQVDIVGDGSTRLHLERLAVELGIEQTVHFRGFVGRELVKLYLSAADVYVALQDYSNVGSNMIEALSTGKPVIASDAGTTVEIVRDGIEGIVLTDTAPEAVADAICTLLSNDSLRERLGRSAQERARSVYRSWPDRIAWEVDEIERTYRSKFGGRTGHSKRAVADPKT